MARHPTAARHVHVALGVKGDALRTWSTERPESRARVRVAVDGVAGRVHGVDVVWLHGAHRERTAGVTEAARRRAGRVENEDPVGVGDEDFSVGRVEREAGRSLERPDAEAEIEV